MLPSLVRGIAVGTVAIVGLVASCSSLRGADFFGEVPAKELHQLPLLFTDDFQQGNLKHWEFSSEKSWKVLPQRKNYVMSLTTPGIVKTSVRSPFNRALIKDLYVSDCVIDVRMQSTVKDYAHRDLCVFLGFQDVKHYYYVHLAKKADKHANQIFIVDNADRVMIEKSESNAGTNWDDHWHHVRVVRKVEDGLILVFFDDMEKPVMKAFDKTFTWGQVGVGSFDDRGDFDNVYIYGTKALPPVDKRLVVP